MMQRAHPANGDKSKKLIKITEEYKYVLTKHVCVQVCSHLVTSKKAVSPTHLFQVSPSQKNYILY